MDFGLLKSELVVLIQVEVESFAKTKELPAVGEEFPVLVRVKAASHWAPRASVDVVIVVDLRAAVQDGKKLEHLKEALMVAVGKLGACDRLSVVYFRAGKACRLVEPTYMSCSDRWKATRAIQNLVPGEGERTDACFKEVRKGPTHYADISPHYRMH